MDGWSRIGRWLLLLSILPPAAVKGQTEITLRSGFALEGSVRVETNRIELLRGGRTYLLSARQLLTASERTSDQPDERFAVQQTVAEQAPPVLSASDIRSISPFDAFGRRTVVLGGPRNRSQPVYQAITQLYPEYAVVRGTNRTWSAHLALDEIPGEILAAVLTRSIDPSAAADRAKVIQFLLQAGRLEQADQELTRWSKEFPDQNATATQMASDLQQRVHRAGLERLERALAAGQWNFADELADRLTVAAKTSDQAAAIEQARDPLRRLRERTDLARALLERIRTASNVQADAPLSAALAEISRDLSPNNVDRLRVVLDLADSPDVGPDGLAALAISGWTIGPELAQQNGEQARRIWNIRQSLVALTAAEQESQVQRELAELQRLAVTPDLARAIIEKLPPPVCEIEGDEPVLFTAKSERLSTLRYHLRLPPEYDRYRGYPAVITLHGLRTSPVDQCALWHAASREGMIVIAPEYRDDPHGPYAYSIEEHLRLLAIVADARRRLAIDPDRVFLSGHELGGFACWDVGMAHPDQFAGLIPVCAAPMFYGVHYWPNLGHLPVYAIDGSLDGGNPAATRAQMDRYFSKGFDVVYVEYPGRGNERFAAELNTAIDWIRHQKRVTHPTEFSAVSARTCDRNFYWVQIDSFLPTATIAPELFLRERGGMRPARIEAKLLASNNLTLRCSGIDGLRLQLPWGFTHLDDPALTVRVNGRVVHRGAVEMDLDGMLRHWRRVADRRVLIAGTISVPRF